MRCEVLRGSALNCERLVWVDGADSCEAGAGVAAAGQGSVGRGSSPQRAGRTERDGLASLMRLFHELLQICHSDELLSRWGSIMIAISAVQVAFPERRPGRRAGGTVSRVKSFSLRQRKLQ